MIEVNDKDGSGDGTGKPNYVPPLAGLIILLALYFFYYQSPQYLSHLRGAAPPNASTYGKINLNGSDISSVFGARYTPLEVDNLTVMSQALQRAGYYYISVSEFNSTVINTSSAYPRTVSSSVMVLNSSYMANQTMQKMLAGAVQQGPSGYDRQNVSAVVYTYMGRPVMIYSVSYEAALDLTGVQPGVAVPVYQSLGAFVYNDTFGSVTTDGYMSQGGNATTKLAELLFGHVVATPG